MTNNTDKNNIEIQQAVTAAMDEQKKKKKKKRLIIAIVIIAVIIAICALASSGDSENTENTTASVNSSETASAQSADKSTTEAEQKIEAGTAVTADDLKISYLSCSADYKDYNEYLPPKDGYKVIRAEFEFENLSSVDQFISGTECYADNSKCELYFGTDDASFDAVDTVSPGRKVKAAVYYEVPKDSKNIEIEIDGDFWKNEKIIFVVK